MHVFKKIIQRLKIKKTDNQNISARREQLKNGLALLLIGCVSYAGYWYSTAKPIPKTIISESKFDGIFDAHFNRDSDDVLLKRQQQQIDSLQDLISKKQSKPVKTDEKTNHIIKKLEERLVQLEQENNQTKQELLQIKRIPIPKPQDHNLSAGIETIRFNQQSHEIVRSSANYVWAGTFASGILLTGVHADAGINGSKDTGTVMVRLTTGGIMPNGQRSRLEGCFVLGSSYGDLSGSAVVIHLETLSCADKQLNFEKKVYGSVFDIDAMQDLRGTALLKTKPLLEYTAAAGLLAGAGDGLKNLGATQSINENGSMTLFPANNIARSAVGSALSNPANKISDYIMKIADIYHPLVIAKPGRRVTVLFIKGFWIDPKHKKYESGRAITPNLQSNATEDVTARASQIAEQQLLQQGVINHD